MQEEGVIDLYYIMDTPQTGWVVCWSCIHVSFICVSYVVRPCDYFLCMVWVMVAVRLPWEVDGVMVDYFIMFVWFIMHFLCMLVFTCGEVYSDVVVVVLREVMVCVLDMVMH